MKSFFFCYVILKELLLHKPNRNVLFNFFPIEFNFI